ncbi:hypothetical protein D9758_012901 [Tetrapyrgos nigripes]|uniref:Uncharacterized protein n=1 Tax=Tetrapyrgos nigripes TaxID=182062 RepID=A0A8H5CN69_9AGAR|nr:hypothetical protein D9758_012901 [Tetrapyrgos nigripes]
MPHNLGQCARTINWFLTAPLQTPTEFAKFAITFRMFIDFRAIPKEYLDLIHKNLSLLLFLSRLVLPMYHIPNHLTQTRVHSSDLAPTHGNPRSSFRSTRPPISRFSSWSSVSASDLNSILDETTLPTVSTVQYAASLCVRSETDLVVPFGSLFSNRKTILTLARYPLCQDYMFSISRNVSPEVLAQNGIFRTPFSVYTDRTHAVYLQTTEAGPRSEYIRHGAISGIGMLLANAVKARMSVWKAGGDISQIEGEFIFGPDFQCSYVHRMRYTRSHDPILDVVRAAAIDMDGPILQFSDDSLSNEPSGSSQNSSRQLLLAVSRDVLCIMSLVFGTRQRYR